MTFFWCQDLPTLTFLLPSLVVCTYFMTFCIFSAHDILLVLFWYLCFFCEIVLTPFCCPDHFLPCWWRYFDLLLSRHFWPSLTFSFCRDIHMVFLCPSFFCRDLVTFWSSSVNVTLFWHSTFLRKLLPNPWPISIFALFFCRAAISIQLQERAGAFAVVIREPWSRIWRPIWAWPWPPERISIFPWS